MAQLVEHIVHIDGVTGSSPVATTAKALDFQGLFHFLQGQIPQPYPNRLFVPALLNDFVRKGVFFISVDASGSHAVHLPGHDVPDKVLISGGHFLRARALKQALSDEA